MKNLIVFSLTIIYLLSACTAQEKKKQAKQPEENTEEYSYTNALINESSPYLLQHAHNPVDWFPWADEALAKAKKENKLLIISVGYAACHWCHVMEDESFENEEVANFMNEHFISIKVDREERPDVDQVYMSACQLASQGGCGWPLNVIALPDARPIFAGTYFPKAQWMNILKQIQNKFEKEPERLDEFAKALTDGVRSLDIIPEAEEGLTYTEADLKTLYEPWQELIDFKKGGRKGNPKFPTPSNYDYLLQYYFLSKEASALEAVEVTLDNMAAGGIYDHLGGGFARYSTDAQWKVPHFEKMLYDNGQLVSLYAKAYQLTQKPTYKKVVYETLAFIEREMTAPQGGFYSSYDADSEGEEGKYYVWEKSEMEEILGGEDAKTFMDFYHVKAAGNWEGKKNILYRDIQPNVDIAPEKLEEYRGKLLKAREERVKPGLDDKILTSWNALMLKGYVDAYRVFDDPHFLAMAKKNADFLLKNMADKNRLYRNYKEGKASINAFLDDYALMIESMIALYQATFEEKWLKQAQNFTQYTLKHFYDSESGLFYYTSDQDSELITRKIVTTDNVIPASNSVMAKNLYHLGHYFYEEDYIAKAKNMLNRLKEDILENGHYYSNWAVLLSYFVEEPYEVAIVGNDWQKMRKELDQQYLPNVLLLGGSKEGSLPLLENKLRPGATTIYVCKEKVCKFPVNNIPKALELIN